ncbi:MAG TPA: CapA family protein [Bacteroidales bacterium]|nr:CapA family protein [Bacteroidales bacterium]
MNNQTSLLFLGDVVPYKPFRFNNNLKTVINLECPISRKGKPISGKVNLSVSENHLKKIFGTNLLGISLGNNHILDYGMEGLFSTLKEIDETGTDYFGINFPDNESHNPLIVDFAGRKIAFMAIVNESTAPLVEFDDFNYLTINDKCEITRKINLAKKHADRIVAYVHWGLPDSSYPSKENIIEAHRLIDEGVNIVIGTHAHAPQPVEKYKNGIIAYNLGNFIMPSFRNTPSFYDEDGNALSFFSKRLMLWNRISWGILVDFETFEFEVRKFIFIADRIIELHTTPMDKYLTIDTNTLPVQYDKFVSRHLKTRSFYRKMRII